MIFFLSAAAAKLRSDPKNICFLVIWFHFSSFQQFQRFITIKFIIYKKFVGYLKAIWYFFIFSFVLNLCFSIGTKAFHQT
jgi:hypothetical protein